MATNRFPLKLLAAGLVLATVGSFTLTAWAQPMAGHGESGGHGRRGAMMMGAGQHGGHRGPGGMMHLSERMLDQVNATPEQRAQIKQIMHSAATELQSGRDGRRAQQGQMMQIFTQPTVDARAAEALRLQIAAQHEVASKRMLQAMIETSRVLTPEQRKTLADSMQRRHEMMDRHQRERRVLDAPKS